VSKLKNLDVYLGLKKNKMFNKKEKPYTELLGKTNRIVEGTIYKEICIPS
jgi:hypothetical protein